MLVVFDEQTLRAEIVRIWGAYGAHADLFDTILKDRRQLGERVSELQAMRRREVEG
jgi:hypothetical protein